MKHLLLVIIFGIISASCSKKPEDFGMFVTNSDKVRLDSVSVSFGGKNIGFGVLGAGATKSIGPISSSGLSDLITAKLSYEIRSMPSKLFSKTVEVPLSEEVEIIITDAVKMTTVPK